jgi:hypothetical protein
MPYIQRECPYCLTVKAAFSGKEYLQIKPGISDYAVFMQCSVCGECIVAKLRNGDISGWAAGRQQDPAASIIETWPKAAEQKAPPYTPDNVKRFYLQGIDSLQRRNFDAAGTMFRKALDAALRAVHAEGKGTLEKRINSLPDALGITPAMKEWAHNIRDLGNDAAHEYEPFEEGEAQALQAFAELFLTYVFTLPGMIEARRPKLELT